MKKNGSITSMDAFQSFQITRLAARISDLRQMGYEIETIMEHKNHKRYARYILKGQPDLTKPDCPSR